MLQPLKLSPVFTIYAHSTIAEGSTSLVIVWAEFPIDFSGDIVYVLVQT